MCYPQKTYFKLKHTHIQSKEKGIEKDITFMELEGIASNEIGQTEQDNHHMISST